MPYILRLIGNIEPLGCLGAIFPTGQTYWKYNLQKTMFDPSKLLVVSSNLARGAGFPVLSVFEIARRNFNAYYRA